MSGRKLIEAAGGGADERRDGFVLAVRRVPALHGLSGAYVSLLGTECRVRSSDERGVPQL